MSEKHSSFSPSIKTLKISSCGINVIELHGPTAKQNKAILRRIKVLKSQNKTINKTSEFLF